jgi:hypothetical protein
LLQTADTQQTINKHLLLMAGAPAAGVLALADFWYEMTSCAVQPAAAVMNVSLSAAQTCVYAGITNHQTCFYASVI